MQNRNQESGIRNQHRRAGAATLPARFTVNKANERMMVMASALAIHAAAPPTPLKFAAANIPPP